MERANKKYTGIVSLLFVFTTLVLGGAGTYTNSGSGSIVNTIAEQRVLYSTYFLYTTPIPILSGLGGYYYFSKGAHPLSFMLLGLSLIAYGVYIYGSLCALVGYGGMQYMGILNLYIIVPIAIWIILKIYSKVTSKY